MTTLNIHISENARAFVATEAAKRGLPDPGACVAAILEEAADKNGAPVPTASFHDTVTDLNQLILAQGVKPITDPDELVADFWPQDESADDFISALREWRCGLPSSGRHR